MAREFERTERVSHFLHEELARLLQSTVRDPRVQEVNLTGVEVSRDLSHAKVFFTLMSDASSEERAEVTAVLSKVSGFLRSELAKASTMRTVPRISFRLTRVLGGVATWRHCSARYAGLMSNSIRVMRKTPQTRQTDHGASEKRASGRRSVGARQTNWHVIERCAPARQAPFWGCQSGAHRQP